MAEVRAVYEGLFDSSLRWQYVSQDEPGSPGSFWGELPSGYQPVTTVTGRITLGQPQFFKGSPLVGSQAVASDCPDRYNVPAAVELATGDGALAGTARGYVGVGPTPSHLLASLDLAEARGSLNLHLDPGAEYLGSAYLDLGFSPEGRRGEISVSVFPSIGASYSPGYFPLTSQFPDDRCSRSFPSNADSPIAWLGGQTATQVVAAWNTALGGLTIHGLRHDCSPHDVEVTPVDVSFEIGTPDPSVCTLAAWPAGGETGRLGFTSPIRLRTSDGRIDAALVHGWATPNALELGSDEALYPNSSDPSAWLPVDQFAARTGIQGVNPAGRSGLGYYVQADFNRSEGTVSAAGSLSVMGLDCTSGQCEIYYYSDVRWPLGEEAMTPLCQYEPTQPRLPPGTF